MALGIVSDEDFESEISNSGPTGLRINPSNIEPRTSNNSINPSNIDQHTVINPLPFPPSVGRRPEVTNIPQSLRKMLGEETSIYGLKSAKHLVSSIGGVVSQPTLSTYARGEISPGQKSEKSVDLTQHINARKVKISSRALNKLNLALSLIDQDKLLECSAKELSSVAKDMAIVSKQMEPTVKSDEKVDPVQFHFYSPTMKKESDYGVVIAKDNY